MEFALSPDQTLMQDSLRSALARASTLDAVRQVASKRFAWDATAWRTVCELGIPAILVPEEHGGLGLSLLDMALASEELGRVVAPVPFLGSCVIAPLALLYAGTREQQARWFPAIAKGESVVGVALAEAIGGAFDGAGLEVRDAKLYGSALFVLDGALANNYLVATRDRSLFWVDADGEGVEREALPALDSTRPFVKLHLAGAKAELLPNGHEGVLNRLRDAAWVMLAADVLGAGWAMIDKSVAYAHERRQFGRQIGSFQAVKHMCSEMAAEMEITRGLVWYAAYAFNNLPDESALCAAHAKSILGDAGNFVARTATEIHGGMGITDELGLHFWFKRIGTDRQLFGSPQQVRRHAAQLQSLSLVTST